MTFQGKHLVWLIAALLLLLAPLAAYPLFLIKILTAALLAASVNFLVGYAGLLSFGHAMFYGSAAYVSGHVLKTWGWMRWSALPRACWSRPCWAWSPACWPSGARACTSR